MVLRLTFLSHAPTAATRTASFPADDPLDGPGLVRARAVALRSSGAALYWRSPALAARQTAEAMNVEADIEPALRECDYGRWAGRTLDAVQADDPAGTAQWLDDPARCPHGGESVLALLDRVSAWLAALADRSGEVVAITHASVVRAAVVAALASPPRAFWRIDVAPLTVTRLRGNAGSWTLASSNRRLERRP